MGGTVEVGQTRSADVHEKMSPTRFTGKRVCDGRFELSNEPSGSVPVSRYQPVHDVGLVHRRDSQCGLWSPGGGVEPIGRPTRIVNPSSSPARRWTILLEWIVSRCRTASFPLHATTAERHNGESVLSRSSSGQPQRTRCRARSCLGFGPNSAAIIGHVLGSTQSARDQLGVQLE